MRMMVKYCTVKKNIVAEPEPQGTASVWPEPEQHSKSILQKSGAGAASRKED
jgi:hypothetical protein